MMSQISNQQYGSLDEEYLDNILLDILDGNCIVLVHGDDISPNFTKTPGIYFILSEDREVIYIGQSQAIGQRLNSAHHVFDKLKHTEIAIYIVEDRINRLVLERHFIKAFCPKYNNEYLDFFTKRKEIKINFTNVDIFYPDQIEEDPVQSSGVGLRASEWARFDAIAESMGANRHKIAAWALRDFLKRYDAGEIQTPKRPTLPGM